MEEIYKENITELKNFLVKVVGENKDVINLTNIIEYTTILMKKIEKSRELSGLEKKEIVLQALRAYVKENIVLENDFIEISKIIENTVPKLIDTLIKLENKEISIKSVIKSGCCGFILK
tara:strand:- start:1017 stop:1373 length:357 start_codon:yes stop_codon:yes gene_type:complete